MSSSITSIYRYVGADSFLSITTINTRARKHAHTQRAKNGAFLLAVSALTWSDLYRSTSKMAMSVFPGVRLLSIGDANGDIQRHSEQQPLRLEVKTTQDAALINLSNGEWTPPSIFSVRPALAGNANAM